MFDSLYEKLAHLPVLSISRSVAEQFSKGDIPIITSPVASGKTMIVPAACAAALYAETGHMEDEIDNTVYVLEPTRFLAANAAESLRRILGPEHEYLVGCVFSTRAGDDNMLHPRNRVIFTTVGYALHAGIVSTKMNFILDEAHETSIDLSITKAILRDRMIVKEEPVLLAIMSATIDPDCELDFWGDRANHFTTEGSSHPVEFLHRPAQPVEEAVIELITDHNRTGILVFVEGVQVIEETKNKILQKLEEMDLGMDIEIYGIHGGSDGPERHIASADPEFGIKILIGTNVLESGVSLPWVNGGVSNGKTNIMKVNGNIHRLVQEDLPTLRIKQQCGRVGRFGPGVFILADTLPMHNRANEIEPDICRLPLTELIMHVASMPHLRLSDLQFNRRETPDPKKLAEAITLLKSHDLIEETEPGVFVLTLDGRATRHLPLSFVGCVAYCEALRKNMVSSMLPLVAMIEIGDIRFDRREMLGGTSWPSSDLVHATIVAAQYIWLRVNRGYNPARLFAEEVNLSTRKMEEYVRLLSDLEEKTQTLSDLRIYLSTEDKSSRKILDRITKSVLFRAYLLNMYHAYGTSVDIPGMRIDTVYHNTAMTSKTTRTDIGFGVYDTTAAYAGTLRSVTTKTGKSFVVLENITVFSKDDFTQLIGDFGEARLKALLPHITSSRVFQDYFYLKEPKRVNESKEFSNFEYNGKPTLVPTHTEGTMASALKAVLNL